MRIYFKDGHQEVIDSKRQANGLLKVSNSYYDPDGYYRADKSFDLKDVNRYRLIDELDSIEQMNCIEKIV